MNDAEIEQLKRWAKNILKDDADKFDFHQEIDAKISLGENKNILKEKFCIQKHQIGDIKPKTKRIRSDKDFDTNKLKGIRTRP